MTQPDAHELLDIARSTLLEQLLPALPGELRYPALMIANAMAIAARESRLGLWPRTRSGHVWPPWSTRRPQPCPTCAANWHGPFAWAAMTPRKTIEPWSRHCARSPSPDWPSAIPRPCPERRQPSHSRQTSTQKDNHELHPPGRTARLAGQDPRLHRRTGHPARERPPPGQPRPQRRPAPGPGGPRPRGRLADAPRQPRNGWPGAEPRGQGDRLRRGRLLAAGPGGAEHPCPGRRQHPPDGRGRHRGAERPLVAPAGPGPCPFLLRHDRACARLRLETPRCCAPPPSAMATTT